MSLAPEPFVRVVRGDPDEETLAALTAVLLAKLATAHSRSGPHGDEGRSRRAGWRRPDYVTGYRSPASWR